MCSTTRNFDQSAAFTNKVKLNKTWQENPRVCLDFVGLNPGWCTPYNHLYVGGKGGGGGCRLRLKKLGYLSKVSGT